MNEQYFDRFADIPALEKQKEMEAIEKQKEKMNTRKVCFS